MNLIRRFQFRWPFLLPSRVLRTRRKGWAPLALTPLAVCSSRPVPRSGIWSKIKGAAQLLVPILTLAFAPAAFADVSENFDGQAYDSSYGTLSYNGFYANNALTDTSYDRSAPHAWRLRNQTGSYMEYQGADGNGKDGGVGTISFWYRAWDASPTCIYSVQVNVNGGGWSTIGTLNYNSTTYTQYSYDLNEASDNVIIRITRTSGERLLVDDFSITDYAGASTDSDSGIIRDTAFTEPSNVAYASYQASSLTYATSYELARFKIEDTASGDSEATTLTDLTLAVANSANLRQVALYDGTTEIAEGVASASVTFSSISGLAASSGGTKSFSVRASFQSSVTDNQQVSFTISSATADSAGSIFAAADAGGAASSITDDRNRIEVTASKLVFSSVPGSVGIGVNFSATAEAQDVNNNVDLDSSASVTITQASGSGTLTGGGAQSLSGGEGTFASLQMDTAGVFTLQAAATGLTPAISGNITASDTTVGNAVDYTPGSGWTQGGDANWFYQTTTTHDGTDAAESGDIADSETSEISFTVTGPGVVTFWWNVSSESSYDYLQFWEDGTQIDEISGTPGWAQVTHTVSVSGSVPLKWIYEKDSSTSTGEDAGYLDQIEWSACPTVPVATAATSDGSDRFTANWESVSGATAYYLDVATADTFSWGSSGTLVEEDFTSFSDWTDSGTASDSSHSGDASPCRAFGPGDSLISPAVDNPAALQFFQDASSGGDGNSFDVEYKVGAGSWTVLQSVTATSSGSTETIDLTSSPDLSGSTDVQFRFSSTFYTWYLDDVLISGASGASEFLTGYNGYDAGSSTSHEVTGLDPETTYYYRVRAYSANCGETDSSGTQSVTTDAAVLAPSIGLDPVSLDFGMVALGGSSSLTIAVANNGTLPLTVVENLLSGSCAGSYSVLPGSLTVGTDSVSNLTVTFTPLAVGSCSATLTVSNNTPGNGSPEVSLSGSGYDASTIQAPVSVTAEADGAEMVGLDWTLAGTAPDVIVLRSEEAITATSLSAGTAYASGDAGPSGTEVVYHGSAADGIELVVAPGSTHFFRLFGGDGTVYSADYSDTVPTSVETSGYGSSEVLEQFAYTNNLTLAVNGEATGQGWAGAWTGDLMDWTVADANLSVGASEYPVPHANRIQWDDTSSAAADSSSITRELGTARSRRLFVSFLMDLESTGTGKEAGLTLMSGSGAVTEELFLGKISGEANRIGIVDVGDGTTNAATGDLGTGTVIVVGELNPQENTVRVWAYATDSAIAQEYTNAVGEAAVTWSNESLSVEAITGFRLSAASDASGALGEVVFDELYVASLWDEVLHFDYPKVYDYTVGTRINGTNYLSDGDLSEEGKSFDVSYTLYHRSGIGSATFTLLDGLSTNWLYDPLLPLVYDTDLAASRERYANTILDRLDPSDVALGIHTSRVFMVAEGGKTTNTVLVAETGGATDLFFGEFGEGNNYDKYVEIYNGTGGDVDLSQYLIANQKNPSGAETNDYTILGWSNYCHLAETTTLLGHGETILILNGASSGDVDASMTNELESASPSRSYLITTNEVLTVSGDDPVALFHAADTNQWVDVCGIGPSVARYIMRRLADSEVPRSYPLIVETNQWDYRDWESDRATGYTNFLATAGVYDRNVGLGGYITFTVYDDDTNSPSLSLTDIKGLGAQNYYAASGELLFYDFGNDSAETNLQPARTYPSLSVADLTVHDGDETPKIHATGYSGGSGGAAVVDNGWVSDGYWEFAITVQTGFQLDMQKFSFASYRTSSGPTTWALYTSTDGYTAPLANGNLTAEGSYEFIEATSLTTSEASGSVIYRLYASGASGGNSSWRLDDISFTGQVSSASGAFIATDSDLNTNGVAVSATVQDASGVYGVDDGSHPPRVDLTSPLGVVAPAGTFGAGPANGGAVAAPAGLAGTNGFTFSDIVLGVYTARITATDYDTDRTGDSMTAVLTNSLTVIDDDSAPPQYSTGYRSFDGKTAGSEANAVTDGDLVDGLSISNRVYDAQSGLDVSSLQFRIQDPEGWDSGVVDFVIKPAGGDGSARTNKYLPENSVAQNAFDVDLNGGRALGIWTSTFYAVDADADRPNDSASVIQSFAMHVIDDDKLGPPLTHLVSQGVEVPLATAFELHEGWSAHGDGNWTETVNGGVWTAISMYIISTDGRGTDVTTIGYHAGFNAVGDSLQLPDVDQPGWVSVWGKLSAAGESKWEVQQFSGGTWNSLGVQSVTSTEYAEFVWKVDSTQTGEQLRLALTERTSGDRTIYFDDLVVTPYSTWTNTPVAVSWPDTTDEYTGDSGIGEYRRISLGTPAPLYSTNGASLGLVNSTSFTATKDNQGIVTGYVFAVDGDDDRGDRDRAMGLTIPMIARLDITPPTAVPMLANGVSTDEVDDPTTQFDIQWDASAVGPDDPTDATRYPAWGGGSRSLLSPWKSYRIYYSPFDSTAVPVGDSGQGNGSAYIYTNFLATGAYSTWPSISSSSTVLDPSATGTNYLALADFSQNRIRLYDLDYDQDYAVIIVGVDEAGNEGPATPGSWATNNTIRFALSRGRMLEKTVAQAAFPNADSLSNTNAETAAALYWIAAGPTNEQGVYTSVRKEYDLIRWDSTSFEERTNNEWNLVGTVRTNWFVDDGGQSRSRGNLRFYRASYKDRWKNSRVDGVKSVSQRPLASEEVYALHNVVLSSGQNFTGLHGVPYTNTFTAVFGGLETLPGGVSALPASGATVVEFFVPGPDAANISQYYLDANGRWVEVGGGDITDLEMPSDFFSRGFSITLPDPLPTNYVTTNALNISQLDEAGQPLSVPAMVWSPIMRVPTNGFSQVISTGSQSGRTSTLIFNVAALRLPVAAHPGDMRLLESGFVNGPRGQSDEIYTMNTATKGVQGGSTLYCDAEGVWRFVNGNGLVPSGFFKPNDVIVIVSRNWVGEGSWTWTYHPAHFYTLPDRWMGS